jgi:hypothetical protein
VSWTYRGPFITALGKIWCPEHFTCATPSCRRPLQDLGFVEEQGQLYCEYCFEQYLAPPCSKCSAKIKGVHSTHFLNNTLYSEAVPGLPQGHRKELPSGMLQLRLLWKIVWQFSILPRRRQPLLRNWFV